MINPIAPSTTGDIFFSVSSRTHNSRAILCDKGDDPGGGVGGPDSDPVVSVAVVACHYFHCH